MGIRTQLFRWFPLVSKKNMKRRIAGYRREIDRLEIGRVWDIKLFTSTGYAL